MKVNPYPVLLTIGLLMFATVFFAQTGANAALLKAGAASLDKDISKFAAKTVASLRGQRPSAATPSAQEQTGSAADVAALKIRVASLDDDEK
jgi:hypothetical protein